MTQPDRERTSPPSYAELVYDVLRAAGHPLSFQEVFDAVQRRREIATRDPKGTIRGALGQGPQLISLGDGRYAYLPHLVRGSLLRVPLSEEHPANAPLVFPDEVRHALWPSFFEQQMRQERGPVRLRLPDGREAPLLLDMVNPGMWGSPIAEPLRAYLAGNHAAAGDSFLIRVLDAEARQAEAWLEHRRDRNTSAIARRNQEVADAAYEVLRRSRSGDVATWDLAIALLARGLYRADVAPDPLDAVLRADRRFVFAGLSAWMLAETMTPAMRATIRERERLQKRLPHPPTGLPTGRVDVRSMIEGILANLGLWAAGQGTDDAARRRADGQRHSAGGARSRRARAGGPTYRLKVTLRGVRPPIWRRLLVSADAPLAHLHDVIQMAMGWTDSHLHEFEAGQRVIGVPSDEDGREVEDERQVRLGDVAPAEKARLHYRYDFGDSWEHDLVVEKVLPPQGGVRYAACLAGRRACPPEDVGGLSGYAEFLEAIQDPDHDEHDDMLTWAGGAFDPEAFDLQAVNAALERLR